MHLLPSVPTHNEIPTHNEMTSMAQHLQILNSELMAAKQEDEGATHRIEELERYWTMPDDMALHLEAQYRQLRSEFNEQMDHACTIMLHAGFGIKDQMHRLRIELDNVERTAKQEATAVGYANDRSCALHLDMLKADDQHQSFRNTLSLSITRLETEVESADIKPDEIMRECRGSLRTEYDCYAECERHLAMEESQLRLKIARNESLQSQVVAAEGRNAEGKCKCRSWWRVRHEADGVTIWTPHETESCWEDI